MNDSGLPVPRIPGYRDFEKLKQGGMGVVWAAVDDQGRRVAVKLLPLHISDYRDDRSGSVRRFRREIAIFRKLPPHPNVVRYYDSGETDEGWYLVMEFIAGETLEEYATNRGEPLGLDRVLAIELSLLEALSYCHDHDLIHRDIKPSNIIVTEDGQLKLIDFGISLLLGDDRLTRTGIFVGTERYAAPEQLRGEKNIDLRADLYSAGLVFYELLTGTLPDMDLLGKEHPELVPPSHFDPEVPPQLDEIVASALQPRPEERFQSAQEFLTGIRGLMESRQPMQPDKEIDAAAEEIRQVEHKGNYPLCRYLHEHHRFRHWLEAARNNNSKAKWLLGLCYQFGCGTEPDTGQAEKWFMAASRDGHAAARYRLALLLNARGQSPETVADLLLKPAKHGYALAQYRLGILEWQKLEDWSNERAIGWFRQAMQRDFGPAWTAMGMHHEKGWGIDKNVKKAIEHYERAAQLGEHRAMGLLGVKYKSGNGVKRDMGRALQYLTEAAGYGDAIAQYELARLYLEGEGIQRNPERARELLRMAVSQHYEKALLLLRQLETQAPSGQAGA